MVTCPLFACDSFGRNIKTSELSVESSGQVHPGFREKLDFSVAIFPFMFLLTVNCLHDPVPEMDAVKTLEKEHDFDMTSKETKFSHTGHVSAAGEQVWLSGVTTTSLVVEAAP